MNAEDLVDNAVGALSRVTSLDAAEKYRIEWLGVRGKLREAGNKDDYDFVSREWQSLVYRLRWRA